MRKYIAIIITFIFFILYYNLVIINNRVGVSCEIRDRESLEILNTYLKNNNIYIYKINNKNIYFLLDSIDDYGNFFTNNYPALNVACEIYRQKPNDQYINYFKYFALFLILLFVLYEKNSCNNTCKS